MLDHFFSFLGIDEEAALVIDDEIRRFLDFYVHFERLRSGPFNRFPAHAQYTETLYACIATPLDHNFSISRGVAQLQTKRCSFKAKRAIGLKLECRLGL